MRRNAQYNIFDIVSIGIILFIFIFSAIRFSELPQWIDEYYHLSVANGFIRSGGWVGWNWWDFAPSGRPQIYPPFYHIILVFLIKFGLSALDSARVTGVLIVPVFFFVLWHTIREIHSSRFSFFTALILSSFVPFYSSVSGNIPASISLIFGLYTWFFIKRKKMISAVLCLTLSFYSHSGIPWIFFFSALLLSIFDREVRSLSLKVISLGLLLSSPILYHEFIHAEYVALHVLRESRYISFSVFVVLAALLSMPLHIRKRNFYMPLFWGYLLGSILIFFKYPYRFFSAQGMIGLAFFCALFLERMVSLSPPRKARALTVIIAIYLFLCHTTFNLDGGNFNFKLLDSTYYNFLTGRIYRFVSFRSFVLNSFLPIAEIIERETSLDDIISSNVSVASQVFCAITKRPTSSSMLWEVRPKEHSYYKNAKLIVWVNVPEGDITEPRPEGLKKIYGDSFAAVFLNPDYRPALKIIRSKLDFNRIRAILFIILIMFAIDNIHRPRPAAFDPQLS